ncbi:MAG: hypothetical protein ACE5FP_04965, partial [Gemmatimonadota bacterium]
WRPSASACDYSTPRIRPLPMFDPREAPANGRKEVPLTNFGSVFVEEPQPGNDFTAIWLGLLPSDPETEEDPVEGLPKILSLIK